MDTAIVTMNEKLNGIEVKFDKRPAREVLDELKAHGFRWHNQKQLWYAKQTPERLQLAEKFKPKEPEWKYAKIFQRIEEIEKLRKQQNTMRGFA